MGTEQSSAEGLKAIAIGVIVFHSINALKSLRMRLYMCSVIIRL